jgi:molecular chaperone GrpE (heat shock protein)
MFDDLNPEQPGAWKEQLRERFEAWLATVEALPEPEQERDAPDLYALFEELAALRNESRKGNRKSAELFSQFGASLGGFEEEMKRLREHLTRLETAQPTAQDLPRSHCLALVEMLDRLHRMRRAAERMPPPGRLAFLPPSAAWREAWKSLRQGFDILVTHLETLTAQAGLRPIPTAGLAFDPTSMVAVDAVATSAHPANIVLEEISSGYAWREEVLRPAEVRISKALS